jgi:hypothetical protein
MKMKSRILLRSLALLVAYRSRIRRASEADQIQPMKKRISLFIGIGTLNLLLANLPAVARQSTIMGKGEAGPATSADEVCQTAHEQADSDAQRGCTRLDSDGSIVSQTYIDNLSGNARIGFKCHASSYAICDYPYNSEKEYPGAGY